MKSGRIAVVVGAGAFLASLVRCIPSYEFGAQPGGASDASNDATVGPHGDGGGGDDDTNPDGSPIGDAPTDTRIDAPTFFAPTPTSILTTGIATQSGNAQQQHLVFATNSQRWWLFYIDADPTKLKAQWSVDFVHWTDDAALTLPLGMNHGGEGRDFSVAYKNIAGHDVIHAATSLYNAPLRKVWDTRATIAGSAITWETPSLVHDYDYLDNTDGGQVEAGSEPDNGCDPDGVGVSIAASGRVYVATSWVILPGECYCDSNFATSSAVDDGTAWSSGFQSPLFHITVNGTTSARQLIALASGNMLAGWESADTDPPSDESWDTTSGASWGAEDENDPAFFVFPQPNYGSVPSQVQEKNDWSFCRIDDNDIHAVHRKYTLLDGGAPSTQSQVFEHYRFNGAGWTFQSVLADDVGVPGSGVTLVTNGTSLLVATIAQDSTNSVRYATWNGSWSGWTSLVGPDGGAATRNFVSGTNCDDPDHPAITWTEGAAPPYQVMAVPVAGLMP